MGIDPHPAEDEKYGLPDLFHVVQGFLQGLRIFSGPAQEEIVGDMHPRLAGASLGQKDILHIKRFAVPFQLAIAKGLRPEFDVGQSGLGQGIVIAFRGAGGSEKSPPGDAEALAAKSLGNRQTVGIIGIEHGIGDKKVAGALLLQLPCLSGDLIGGVQAQPAALDMGIGAVNTVVGTSPFRLQIQDASPFEIETELGIHRPKLPPDRTRPRNSASKPLPSADDPRQIGDSRSLLQGVKERTQELPFPDDAEIGIQQGHQFSGENGKTAAPDHNRGLRAAPDGPNDPLMSLNKALRGQGIHIVDIPDGQADDIGVETPDCNLQPVEPPDHIHIRHSDLMAGHEGSHDKIESQRIDRIGILGGIGRKEQKLHRIPPITVNHSPKLIGRSPFSIQLGFFFTGPCSSRGQHASKADVLYPKRILRATKFHVH